MQLLSKVKSLFAKRDKRQEKELQEDFLKAIYERGHFGHCGRIGFTGRNCYRRTAQTN